METNEFNASPEIHFANHMMNARIEEMTTDRNVTLITVATGRSTGRRNPSAVTLIVSRDTLILDERGNRIPASRLQVGMIVNASYSSAMTRSIPPQAQAFSIQIVRRKPDRPNPQPQPHVTTIGRILQVDSRNQSITTISNNNPSSVIQFNISPNTIIYNPFGQRIDLSMLFPGIRVRVQHADFMTASIPPQTPASEIQVLRV
ncbi:MAG: hypothetical protein E7269_05210 [Lachnospiraceae bacterium]|nr:hypothetical protein [Lachnospiraceae bacterium]